jgi:hypothetical protein
LVVQKEHNMPRSYGESTTSWESVGEEPILQDRSEALAGARGENDGFVPNPGRTDRDRNARALYARQIQRAAQQAIQRVKQHTLIAQSGWSEPLTVAPLAISVMAFLLKTAADK